MSKEDLERFYELESLMDDETITDEQEEEYWSLWGEIQMEEERELLNSYQFGY